MSKIAFFCIPAFGHTNPTLEVVKELIKRGNEVWYYSCNMMKECIEATGAKFISCDKYGMQKSFAPENFVRMGKNVVYCKEVLANMTLALEEAITEDMKNWQPDCIVSDSFAYWGKMIALKLGIPFISSTTTFALNKYSTRVIQESFGQKIKMLFSMRKAIKSLKKLRAKGYPAKGVNSVLSDDNDTDTIVYTSSEFQPYSETFSDKYAFVGPSIRQLNHEVQKLENKTIYISLGTVNNQNIAFFQNCIKALKDTEWDVIMSIGTVIDRTVLGEIPANFRVEQRVEQIEVLQQVDMFLTHCGMNSVNEALYYGVPLILFPQSSEQRGVAWCVNEVGAGVYLKKNSVGAIKEAIEIITQNENYRVNAKKIAESFHSCGGPKMAADKIISCCKK